jgi:hypothetical protein
MGEGNPARAAVRSGARPNVRIARGVMRKSGVVLGAMAALGASAPWKPGWDAALAPKGEPGPPFVLEGRVLDAGRRPLPDILVTAYHADDHGYGPDGPRHPRLTGTLRTSVLGGYRFHSALPGIGEGSPHIHFRLKGPDGRTRSCTLFLCRAVGAGSDTTFAHVPLILDIEKLTRPNEAGLSGFYAYVWPDTGTGFRCTWDIPFDEPN